jgi:hypothetical protein
MTRKVIKNTKYCQILNQGKIADKEYTYSIEKVFIKAVKREEIRFSLYKDTIRSTEMYIPRSLDVTEEQLLQLIKQSIAQGVFSKDFIESLSQILQ